MEANDIVRPCVTCILVAGTWSPHRARCIRHHPAVARRGKGLRISIPRVGGEPLAQLTLRVADVGRVGRSISRRTHTRSCPRKVRSVTGECSKVPYLVWRPPALQQTPLRRYPGSFVEPPQCQAGLSLRARRKIARCTEGADARRQ